MKKNYCTPETKFITCNVNGNFMESAVITASTDTCGEQGATSEPFPMF